MVNERSDRATFAWPPGAKRILFAVIALMIVIVFYNNERFIVDHTDPSWTYYYPIRWLLVPHGIAGAVALFFGLSQFSTRLRTRRPRLHRNMGRSYIIGVSIAAPMAMYIATQHNALPLQIANFTTALLWLLATGVAFYSIRTKNYQQHRNWMIRSYAITLTFLVVRVIDLAPNLLALDADTSPNMVWLSEILAWVVPTIIIDLPGVLSQRRTTADSDTRAMATA
jgi:uncharacterized membrane protein